jgi:glycosyl transferase family 25
MKTYITHYQPLVDRKTHMIKRLSDTGLNGEFIIDFDREELYRHPLIIPNNFDIFAQPMSKISLYLKHIECYKRVASNTEDYALILEDDAVLCENFKSILSDYIKQLPDDWDMCFLGDCCNLHIPDDRLIPNVNVYLNPWSKCTDSYLIRKKCAVSLLDAISDEKNISSPIDHLLNPLIKNNNYQVYWVEPTIVSQGSENGLFTSSL